MSVATRSRISRWVPMSSVWNIDLVNISSQANRAFLAKSLPIGKGPSTSTIDAIPPWGASISVIAAKCVAVALQHRM